MRADVHIGKAWDGTNELMVGIVLEMILDHGRQMSRGDNAMHYVMVRRGKVSERRVMSGGFWPSSVAVRPMVKRMGIEGRGVEMVGYRMKVSDTGSVYHWMELT